MPPFDAYSFSSLMIMPTDISEWSSEFRATSPSSLEVIALQLLFTHSDSLH